MIDKTVGFALCGSFCTYAETMEALKQFECAPTWDQNADSAYQMPTAISMTAEESEEYYSMYSDIQTLIAENLTKFAVGERSMDEWDSFVWEIPTDSARA